MRFPVNGIATVAVIGLVACSLVSPPEGGAPLVHLPAASVPASPARPVNGTPANRSVIGVRGTMPVGVLPTFMAEDLANGWVYVSNEGSATVTILDGTHVEQTLSVGAGDSGLVYDPVSQFVYVADSDSDQVSIIDGTAVLATVTTGQGPCAPAYDAADGWIYVPDSGSNSVTIVNDTTVVATVSVGEDPVDATYDSNNGTVYITNEESDFENVLEGNATVALAPTNKLIVPFTTVYDPVNHLLYVTNLTPNDGIYSLMTVINGTHPIATFVVDPGPTPMTVNTSSGLVYLPSIGYDAVQVLNGTSLVSSVLVGGDPISAEFDPANGLVYVTDDLTDDVTVMNEQRVVADVDVAENPSVALYDTANGFVYVTDRGAGETTALGLVPGWSVNFTETGLVRGTYWSVTVKEVTGVSTTNSLVQYLPNGSYAYEVGAVVNYTSKPATGVFNVTGNPVEVAVTFSLNPKGAGPGFLGLPNPIGAVLVGTAVALIVGVTVWRLMERRQRRRDRVLRG
jgi:YVTN family beta-propeller protein